MVIIRVTDDADLHAAWDLRREVFVDEQGVPADEEIDDLDLIPTTIHILVKDALGAAATGRVLFDEPGAVHLGRICVARRVRGTGLGKELMRALEDAAVNAYATDLGLTISLSAQSGAQRFYESIGYTYVDDREYLDAGIWHRDMAKRVR